MKKLYKKIAVALLMLMPAMLMAQSVVDYTLASGRNAEKWMTLSNSATTISFSGNDDGISDVRTLPFGFTLGGQSFNNYKVNTNGRIYLGSSATYGSYGIPFSFYGSSTTDYCIAPLGTDLKLFNNSSETYVKCQSFGSSPNRTFVIEWRCGRYGSADDILNFQLQLEEGTNVVRFVYGSSNNSGEGFKPYQIGMKTVGGDCITVDPDANTLIKGITNDAFDFWPGQNKWFEFTPSTTPSCPSMMLYASAVVLSSNRANMRWQASASTNNPTYTLRIINQNTNSVQTFTTTETEKIVTSLEPVTPYTMEVSTTCNPSSKATYQFSTACMESNTKIIGSNLTPEHRGFVNNYYKYSACQALYRSSELSLSAQPIQSIMVYYIDSTGVSSSNVRTVTKNDVTIYMGHTTRTAFNASDDAMQLSQMQVVYNGSLTFDQTGWSEIELSSPFNYDGTSNLVVAVVDNSFSYDGTYDRGKMGVASSSFKGFLWYQSDVNPFSQGSTAYNVPNSSDYRPYISFSSCFVPCTAPTLSLAGITTTSVNFSWTATSCSGTSYSRYEIEYGPAGFSHSEGESQYVNGTTAQVTGLSDGVDYKAYVRVVDENGNAKSEWSNAIEFSTNTCDKPQNVTIVSSDNSSATISWTAALNGTGMYEVEYGPHGFSHGSGTTKNVGATNVQLTGLNLTTVYDFYVRTMCDGNTTSQWTEPILIDLVGINSADNRQVSIYPNPATDQFTVTLNGIDGTTTMTVVDMNGRVVRSTSVECAGDCSNTIEVSDLAKGVYFVRVHGNGVNTIQKIVVK